jgi:hypothetical protein
MNHWMQWVTCGRDRATAAAESVPGFEGPTPCCWVTRLLSEAAVQAQAAKVVEIVKTEALRIEAKFSRHGGVSWPISVKRSQRLSRSMRKRPISLAYCGGRRSSRRRRCYLMSTPSQRNNSARTWSFMGEHA